MKTILEIQRDKMKNWNNNRAKNENEAIKKFNDLRYLWHELKSRKS
jgi:hypothetical protein